MWIDKMKCYTCEEPALYEYYEKAYCEECLKNTKTSCGACFRNFKDGDVYDDDSRSVCFECFKEITRQRDWHPDKWR